jgi:TRAP-type C4-dicarboxylate transport system substrate-binding protein
MGTGLKVFFASLIATSLLANATCAAEIKERTLKFAFVTVKEHAHASTVNLIGTGRDKAQEGRSHERLCPSSHGGDLSPGLEGLSSGGSVLAGGR